MTPERWQLKELLDFAGISCRDEVPEISVGHVTDKAQAVTLGTLFVAIQGNRFDGHDFVCPSYPQSQPAGSVSLALESIRMPSIIETAWKSRVEYGSSATSGVPTGSIST